MVKPTALKHRNLPLLLLKAREALMESRRPALRSHGLSDQQWRVLRVLSEPVNALGLETGRLAREAHLLGPSLTGVLSRMERDGMVVRQRSESDARRSVVRITEVGQALAASLSVVIESQYHDLEATIGQPKLNKLYTLLDELIALQQIDQKETIEMTEDDL
ncbi:homoprotocatechuate degradation operon regulator HpaR [Ottowia thiooxydans]|uniref:Homoprotocatechuate degradation regulator HpaR n=1 Tax=Ottowia thiooxydans TaxID=219182 RepID=A0ABV2Q968_9BURK